MPLTIPAGYGEVIYGFSLTGDPQIMTVACGFGYDDAVTAQAVADDLYDAMAVWVGSTWGSDYQLRFARVTVNDGGTMLEAEHVESTPGIAATNHPVQNLAILVKKVSGVPGRANRGRFYFPPGRLAEVDINNFGLIDTVDYNTIQGEIDDLYAAMSTTAGVTDLVVLHSEDPPGTPSPVTPTIIASFQLEQTAATQRRRLRG